MRTRERRFIRKYDFLAFIPSTETLILSLRSKCVKNDLCVYIMDDTRRRLFTNYFFVRSSKTPNNKVNSYIPTYSAYIIYMRARAAVCTCETTFLKS